MKIDKRWLEKNQIIIYLVVVVLGMSAIKIKYGYKSVGGDPLPGNSIKNLILPTATVVPSVVPTPTISEKDYPLWKYLPYKGKGFTVDQYVAPLTLRMTVTEGDRQTAVDTMTVWLNSFGDLGKDHKVELSVVVTPTKTKP